MSVLRLAGPIFLTLLLASLSALAPGASAPQETASQRALPALPAVPVQAAPSRDPMHESNLIAAASPASGLSRWDIIVPNAGENIPDMGQ
ncbi:hypothetical protein [Arenimonas oryziterrae]|uniref:Uncharacterized protein n=1 Tax=Arenimonas oryziterrae DSM 21050 = YC6267 TaxID=1121015 RepID=A0A091AXF7_9GAMM|nr:hypothetical protein [Arenimonas oryziterrae]KFN43932.1 hypothetical protein N789_08260 [Arenimonas oryziterrae DSM 21050 = YC6267]